MTLNWRRSCVLSPSLICFDQCNLERDVTLLGSLGIEVLHVDVLDGHFSPSMPLGLDAVRQLRARTDMQFDVHLMATANDYFIDELLDIGVQQLVFHVETEPHIDNQLNRIRAKGVRAGVALKPATPVSALDCVIDKCDTILLMLINPGFAWNRGESQVIYADRKIREVRKLIEGRGLSTAVEIDGRVSRQNISDYAKSEVDVFVLGTTCIKRDAIAESVRQLNHLRATLLA